MNRKKQRCPYCGRRMSYFSAFFSRRKAEYVCERCGKESKVVISKIIIPIFIIAAVISLAVMGVWFLLKQMSNPLGIVLVAAPLLVFLFVSPQFVQLEPLKKYKKSMEAKKAGIEFSDNLNALEIDEEKGLPLDNSGQFKINADLFNQIKAERNSPREQAESDELVSDSKQIDKENYVHVIKDVSEEHSTTSVPLKKIHSEGSRVVRQRPTLSVAAEEDDSDVKEYKKPESKDSNQYSGNRRF